MALDPGLARRPQARRLETMATHGWVDGNHGKLRLEPLISRTDVAGEHSISDHQFGRRSLLLYCVQKVHGCCHNFPN
jgi:hypothetical protein